MEWLKQNAAVIAAIALILTSMTFMRWELIAKIEGVDRGLKAEIGTLRAEMLGELRLIQKQFEQLISSVPRWVENEVQIKDLTRRVETLEKGRK